MRIPITILILFISFQLDSQEGMSDLFFLEGELYGGLPIQLSVHTDGDINGYSKYGSSGNIEYIIEGEKTSSGYLLYEFDNDHNLSGILELSEDKSECVWNSIDFSINIPISFSKEIQKTTYDYVSHQSYIAVSYPSVDEAFDKKISNKINTIVRDMAEEYGVKELESGSHSPGNRFSNRTIAINKITLDSKDLISGHLTFYDNQSSDVSTLTYTYDKNKKEMLGLSKIFKKNFNYSFFLKQYINQKKEKMQTVSTPLETSWINATSFHHYVLTDSGLQLLSDYNTIFGRKSFTIPYHEVSSSIGQKSISNYIKNRK